MKQGTLISGAAHGALVAAAIFGLPWLSPRESEPISVTSVSFVSEAAFEAAQQAASAPAAQTPSDSVVLPPEVAAEPELPVVTPQSRPPAEPEEIPETAVLRPDFSAGAPLAGPRGDLAAVSPNLVAPQDPGRVSQPRPRPVPRVEALPQPEAPDDVEEARELLPEISPSAEAELPAPQEEATAPPEAAPEPVTEAAPVAPDALVNVAPPRSRPATLAQAAAVAPSETDTVPEPVTPPQPPQAQTPPPTQNLQSQLEALVASANNATAPTPPSQTQPTQPSAGQGTADVGPPLTSGEREGMRLAVQRCWNLPAGLRDAGELKVTIAAELTVTGAVIDGTIRLIEPSPAPDARYQGAFEAGRRALLRCAPYTDLPAEKYAQWRRLEIVFNPEGMVSW